MSIRMNSLLSAFLVLPHFQCAEQESKSYYNEWDNDEIATKSKVLRLK